LWNISALVLIMAYVAWRLLRAAEYHELAARLGYDGPSRTFPIAYFRQLAPAGTLPQEVWARMASYHGVDYFVAPIVGTTDSIVIQRFTYPMTWDELNVDIEYSGAVVRDIEVTGYLGPGVRRLTADEAYVRLGWRPITASSGQ